MSTSSSERAAGHEFLQEAVATPEPKTSASRLGAYVEVRLALPWRRPDTASRP